MKIFYKILLFTIVLTSCEELLFKENDEKYIVLANEQEVIDLLNGVYDRLIKVHNGNYLYTLSRSDDINIYERYRYEVKKPYDPTYSPGFDFCNDGIYDDNILGNYSGDIYINLYTAMANTNRLIQHLSNSGNSTLLGESYFLRAYCYFKLARLFGTPPLVTDIDVDFFIEKPTYKQVYELIEGDMLKALELLPESYTDTRVPGETPHKGTARAVLAEIYLAMAGYPVNDVSKYAEAAQLAGEVIEQADSYNYGLLDDMADLWKKANSQTKETVFGLFFTDASSNQNTVNMKSLPFSDSIISFYNYDTYQPSMKFFMNFPNQYRRDVSFRTIYGKFRAKPPYEWIGFMHNPIEEPCEFINNCLSLKNKQINVSQEGSYVKYNLDLGKNTVTLILFRYAHTLLTYAEAKTRAGQLDETCYEAVNQIRRRANKVDINTPSEYDLQPGLTPEQFLDSVVWERAWEFCHEPEGRWFDIVRLDLREKLPEYFLSSDQYATIDRSYFNEDWYFYLIPKEDRLVNPNF